MPALSSLQMVELIKSAMQKTPVGTLSISIDGQTVQYSRKQALEELVFWEKRYAKETGRRPIVLSIDLSKGFGSR